MAIFKLSDRECKKLTKGISDERKLKNLYLEAEINGGIYYVEIDGEKVLINEMSYIQLVEHDLDFPGDRIFAYAPKINSFEELQRFVFAVSDVDAERKASGKARPTSRMVMQALEKFDIGSTYKQIKGIQKYVLATTGENMDFDTILADMVKYEKEQQSKSEL